LCVLRFRYPSTKSHLLLRAHFAVFLALALAMSGTVHSATAQSEQDSISNANTYKSLPGYCGVYCLYAVIRLEGNSIDISDLVKPEYIDSPEGSSIKGLMKAAEDHGMHALAVTYLTPNTLRELSYPIILSVKRDIESARYDHYELFLGDEGGKAKLYDPPDPARLVDYQELAPRWGGTGVVVSARPISLKRTLIPARVRFLSGAGAAVLALWWWERRRRTISADRVTRRKAVGLSVAQWAGISAVAVAASVLFHTIDDIGFIARPETVGSMQLAHLGSFLPKLKAAHVHRAFESGDVIIDARWEDDYNAGHIGDAVNIQPDATPEQCREAMAGVSEDARVVIYCRSAQCPYAVIVAKKLYSEGYTNIAYFKGGWLEWKKGGA